LSPEMRRRPPTDLFEEEVETRVSTSVVLEKPVFHSPPQLVLLPSLHPKVTADDFVGARKKREPPGPVKQFTDAKLRIAAAEVEEMIRTRDFTKARPRHFVAMHGVLHARVYGLGPTDPASTRLRAAASITRLLKVHFDEDPVKLAAFVRWVWVREAGREKARRSTGDCSGGRIGLGLQFSSAMVDDYRVDTMRRGGR